MTEGVEGGSAARVSVRAAADLDREVRSGNSSGGQGRSLELPTPEPWPDEVQGEVLLDELSEAIRRYLVLEPGSAEAVALWVVHAHCLDAFSISPRLAITSPERGCGKTTLLDVLGCLAPRPLPTSNCTAAAVFRTIEVAAPTLLIDEADTFLKGNDDLRGILNSGHRRSSAFVLRTVGEDHEPRRFGTWAATAIAMIGRLPDTLADRSISIRLRRKMATEVVAQFRSDRTSDLDRLGSMSARWAADHEEELRGADPAMPEKIVNRTADNWRPLLSIADAAGGEWPERARRIAENIVRGAGNGEEGSVREMLLHDLREVFEGRGAESLPSEVLVDALHRLEGRPWAEWGGRPMTASALARQLKGFDIAPALMRFSSSKTPARGYRRDQFTDAFARYLPPLGASSPS